MRETLADLTRGMSTLAPAAPHAGLGDIGNAANIMAITTGERVTDQAT
jgi:hypothetical protein